MKFKVLIFFLFISMFSSHAQGEASVWYFGGNAGVKFNSDGSVTTLTDGQLNTYEGCATLADSGGNLLFYTDGTTVYNKNHQIMLNGVGLLGDFSSTQSATIVPKPGSTTLFYIFTLDSFAGNNGFRYSIVDMSLDSGLGGITNEKNVLIYTPSNEKIAIVKKTNILDFWIVTHGWNNNSFYSYSLTSAGLSATPIISNVGAVTTGSTDLTFGYMKISPDGSKIAICNSAIDAELLDFDANTGVVSNPLILNTFAFNTGFNYGAEFSSDSKKLYISKVNFDPAPIEIVQYDLNSSTILASAQVVFSSTTIDVLALQLAPNGKIYFAEAFKDKLGVINNPNLVGTNCDVVVDAVDLAGRICQLGLPPFVSSFLYIVPSIQLVDACVNQITTFNFNTSQTVLSASWSFGDGTTSTDISPNHNYAIPGVYDVSVVVNTVNGTGSNSKQITIFPKPTLITNLLTLKQCDDNIDGFSNFNLNETIPLLVSNAAGLTITFHESQADADDNDNAIANFTAYTNQIVSNDIVFVRVENSNGCYKTAQINLIVSTTLIPSSFQIIKTECDDLISGSNTDGIATFDFSDATLQIQNLYPTGQLLTISYYKNLTDALAETNAITNTTNFTNTTSPNLQDIYVRVDSQLNNDCLGLGKHIKLVVERIPIIQPQVIKHCDDNQDGIYTFDTTNLQTNLLNGLTNVIVTYTSQNGSVLQSPFPNSFSTTSQTINVSIKNNYGKQCSYATTIQFTVDDLPEIFGINTLTTTACDDEPFPNQQNGSYPFNTSNFQSTLLGNQAGMGLIVNYYDANNNPLPSPLSNPFNTATQNVTVEILNPLNTTCKATAILPFVVNPVPKIELFGNELVCSNNPTFTKIINAGVLDVTTIADFTYQWFLNGVLIPNQTNYDLTVNTEGIYTVTVTNNLNCSRTRTLTVTASNTATINTIEVSDLSNENSIVVLVSGQGDYQYSLDDETYQNSNEFYNLIPGIYTVYIRDKNGCGTVQEEVSILGIPKYFTPNGDGFNDFWNIKGVTLSNNNEALIYIFDRFGKLLKQISPIGSGWDGIYNGEMLPSEDYWYAVKLEDNRIFKGHFCLKR